MIPNGRTSLVGRPSLLHCPVIPSEGRTYVDLHRMRYLANHLRYSQNWRRCEVRQMALVSLDCTLEPQGRTPIGPALTVIHTSALPMGRHASRVALAPSRRENRPTGAAQQRRRASADRARSEERRVGKECRCGRWTCRGKKISTEK